MFNVYLKLNNFPEGLSSGDSGMVQVQIFLQQAS
jgi:hypothetical protein